jgi:uridine kinase
VNQNPEPFVIGISGISGAGKTWVVKQLCNKLGDSVSVLSLDDYYLPRQNQATDRNGFINYDLPEALNHAQLLLDLKQLLRGHVIAVKRYNFELDRAPEQIDLVAPAAVILVEGVFVFQYPEIDSMFNYRIFIEASDKIVMLRRIKRDVEERGIPEERSIYQWESHVKPSWDLYIEPHKVRCDIVVDNTENSENQVDIIFSHILHNAHPSVRESLRN